LKEIPGDIDLALCAVEYGVWTEDDSMVVSAAKDFVVLYKQYKQNPAAKLNRFIYSIRPEALVYCSMHLALCSLKEGMNAIELFNTVLAETKPEFQQGMVNMMQSEVKKAKIPIQMNVHSAEEKMAKFPAVRKPMYQLPTELVVPKSVGIGG